MSFQGFSRRDPKEEQQWHCAFMDPVRQYKWAHKSCFDAEHFICEAPLQKEEEGDRDKNEIWEIQNLSGVSSSDTNSDTPAESC